MINCFFKLIATHRAGFLFLISAKHETRSAVNLNDEDAENGDAAVVKDMSGFQQILHVLLVVMLMPFTILADVMRL